MNTVQNFLSDPVVAYVTALSLASLLLGAAMHKFKHPREFVAVLSSYGLLPDALLPAAVRAIPLCELALALGLLYPASRQWAGVLGAVLLLVYAGVMARSLLAGRALPDCGCSLGVQTQRVTTGLVWRNALLALLALNLAQSTLVRELGVYDWATVLFAALMGTALYSLANTLISNEVSTRELFHD